MTVSSSGLGTQDLACGYPGKEVLAGLNLSFAPGTATAILGPNGSGKSTFLRTLSGELKPVSGSVMLQDKLIAHLSIEELGRQIAVVPQQEEIAFRFTAWEVVMMGRLARSYGVGDTAEDREAAERSLAFADALDLAHRPVNELSGGERQRVLLARAFAQETDIVLLDEPTTHLDITHQIEFCRLVRQMVQGGKTIIAAMHDLNLVSGMAERAILLGSGGVKLDGPIEEVLNSPILDEVYRVAFRRTKDGGKTMILPPSMN